MPTLSVCIPTWNAAPHLERTLGSLLAQADADLEIHVCDDASDDDTLERARGFADARMHVHANDERLGLAGNWNRALAHARGDLVCLFGQDDLAEPRWAAELGALLAEHRDAGLAFGRRAFVFDDEQSRERLGPFFLERYPAMLAPFYAALAEHAGGGLAAPSLIVAAAMRHAFEINLIGEPSFVVMRRAHPALRGGFDTTMRQMLDWELWTRFVAAGPIAYTANVVGSYRLHARGASTENLPLSRHYLEFGHLLDLVLARYGALLDREQHAVLEHRRIEVRRLQVEHARAEQVDSRETGQR